jgi:hypothetical protein
MNKIAKFPDDFIDFPPEEGFAFFCWHRHSWPDPSTSCDGYKPDHDPQEYCSRMWDSLQANGRLV